MIDSLSAITNYNFALDKIKGECPFFSLLFFFHPSALHSPITTTTGSRTRRRSRVVIQAPIKTRHMDGSTFCGRKSSM